MATCSRCDEEVDSLVRVNVGTGTKTARVCESCADELREEEEIAEGAQSAIQGMMEYKGRR